MIAVRDGVAVSVHEAENLAASPFRFEIDGLEVHKTFEEIEDAAASSARSTTRTRARSRTRRRPTSTSPRGWPGVEWLIVGLRRNARARGALLPHRRRRDPEVEVEVT